jgi:four helix bundle protein
MGENVKYDDWETTVPDVFRGDALWKMKVYRYALFLSDIAWSDVSKLAQDIRTKSLSDQLFRAVGSVPANLEEGYSKRSAKDRARFYEYALGSAHEGRGWYSRGRHVLGEDVSRAINRDHKNAVEDRSRGARNAGL